MQFWKAALLLSTVVVSTVSVFADESKSKPNEYAFIASARKKEPQTKEVGCGGETALAIVDER